jgi:TPR repeat protein
VRLQLPSVTITLTKVVGGLALCGALSGCSNSLEAKCDRGDGAACGALGDQVRNVSRGDANLPRICDLYRRACTGNNDAGCSNLGALLAQSKCTGSPGEARDVLQRACDHGDVGGCNNLGMVLRDGAAGTRVDRALAAASFRKACERAPTACDNLGAMLLDTDMPGATAAFKAGCEVKEETRAAAACCFKLGLAHDNGWGIPVDKVRAASLYALACERGIEGACYALGLIELAGPEPEQKARAAAHFQKACTRGEMRACNNLGLMYADGTGVPRDATQAAELLQEACDGGELRACANLGSRYDRGDGVAQDRAHGKALIERACKGGVAEACVPPAP